MEYKRFGSAILIRLDIGDEVLDSLAQVCRQERVTLASITGLGACDKATVGVYHVGERRYEKTELRRDMEIASLVGNATIKDGQPYLHCHAVLASSEGQCWGGHLNEAHISATGELIMQVLEGQAGRLLDEAVTGLNLLQF